MTIFSHRIAVLADRRPKSIALLLGLISATGFAPLNLWPLTLLAFAGWIAPAVTDPAAMPAWLGWVAVLLLSLYLAVYPALAAWGAWMMRRFAAPPAIAGATLPFLIAFAGLWTLTEWLRSWVFTGFAWNPLAVIAVPHAAAPARWIGTYGTSALVVLAAGVLLLIVARRRIAAAALAAGLIAVVGAAMLDQIPANVDAAVRSKGAPPRPAITVVQPNIGQQDKWEGDKADANFAKLARLTTRRSDTPRLILWPEAAIPDYLESGYPPIYYDRSPAEARGRLTSLMHPGDMMLLGALKLEFAPDGEVVGARNAAMAVHADGTLGPRYDKAHLVPYGEYLPMRPLLSAIGLSRLAPGDIDFRPGPGPRTLDLGRFGRAGLQICYEIIFSGQVVDRANRPDFLFNPSNDAWFGRWGPPQHLAQARLRAIEEGLPVVRATPTGISAVIDADGRIQASVPMQRAGRIDTVLPSPHAPTPFAHHGNVLPVGFALLLLTSAIAFRRRRR